MKNDILVTMKKDVIIQFRITPDVKNALDELVKNKNVSLTRLIEHALVQQYPELAQVLPSL